MRKKKEFTLIAFLILSASFANAQNAKQLELIEASARPTVSQMLSDPAYLATALPDRLLSHLKRYEQRAQTFTRRFPRVIVGLEKAFPGARFAFLGRDTDLLADASEEFFASIGQFDRVTRIHISGGSLKASASDEMITNFLGQAGLSTTTEPGARPFILIDATKFEYLSQTRKIFRAVVNTLKDRGVSLPEIVRRFNVVSLNDDAEDNWINYIDPVYATKEEIRHFFQHQVESFIHTRGQQDDGVILSDGKSLSHGYEWHGSYGPIRYEKNRLVTSPTMFYDTDKKSVAYFELVWILNAVHSAESHASVQELAKANGVTFAASPVTCYSEMMGD